MCPHTTIYVCVLILIGMCPHTTIYLYICPHTTISTCVSSSYYISIRVLILPYTCMCPHTIAPSCRRDFTRPTLRSYYYSYLLLIYCYISMCPHTTIYVCVLTLRSSYYSYLLLIFTTQTAVAALLARHCARPSHARYGIQRLTRAARNTFSAVSGLLRLC